ncbi:MAG: cold shock domain-containing protein, partial [Ignavibacteriaceae bacterium]
NGNITSTPPDLTQKKEVKAESIEVGIPKAEDRVNNKIKIRTGRLNHYDEAKGFGFITDSETKESIFVHRNDSDGDLKTGCQVEFETERGPKGLKAVNVKVK